MKLRKAFTFIEVVATIALIGIFMVPLLRMMVIGKKGSIQSEDFLIVSNLAREKLEEMEVIPFSKINSDFDNFGPIFADVYEKKFRGINKDSGKFYKVFTDIWTKKDKELYSKAYELFAKRYKLIYGRNYIIYPDNYQKYRRIVMVENELTENKKEIKKVNVYIYLKGKNDEPLFTLTSIVTE